MPDGPEFVRFWTSFPHRPKCRPKAECRAYWSGRAPLKDGSRIEPDQWEMHADGAAAYAEQAGDDPYRVNAGKFLYRGMAEGALEEQQEREADKIQAMRRERDAVQDEIELHRRGAQLGAQWAKVKYLEDNVLDMRRRKGGGRR